MTSNTTSNQSQSTLSQIPKTNVNNDFSITEEEYDELKQGINYLKKIFAKLGWDIDNLNDGIYNITDDNLDKDNIDFYRYNYFKYATLASDGTTGFDYDAIVRMPPYGIIPNTKGSSDCNIGQIDNPFPNVYANNMSAISQYVSGELQAQNIEAVHAEVGELFVDGKQIGGEDPEEEDTTPKVDIVNTSGEGGGVSELWCNTDNTSYDVLSVAVDNDGNVYSSGGDKTVRKFSSSGTQLWCNTDNTSYDVLSVAVDNDGNVYSGGGDKTVRKFSSSGTQLWCNTDNTNWVRAVAVDNDGNVYSGGGDKTVRKFSSSGTQLWCNTDNTNWVRAVAVDNDGNVYSSGGDKTVRKFSSSGTQLWCNTDNTSYDVLSVAVDNDGNVYSGSDDGTVRKFSSSGTQLWCNTDNTNWVRAVAVDNDGNVYSGSDDGTVRKFSSSGTQLWCNTDNTNWVRAVAVDNDGNVYSGGGDKTVRKFGSTLLDRIACGLVTATTSAKIVSFATNLFKCTPYIVASYANTGADSSFGIAPLKIFNKSKNGFSIWIDGSSSPNMIVNWIAIGQRAET